MNKSTVVFSAVLKNPAKTDRTFIVLKIDARLSCPNAEGIFRKVTPSESVANIRLTFR